MLGAGLLGRQADPHGLEAVSYTHLDVYKRQIRDHGVFRGFVGFDECRLNHLWTQEQVDTLATFAKVLGVFLFRERAQQALTDQRT